MGSRRIGRAALIGVVAVIGLSSLFGVPASAATTDALPVPFGVGDPYTVFGSAGNALVVPHDVSGDPGDAAGISDDGKTVVESLPNSLFGSADTGQTLYAVTTGAAGTMRALTSTPYSFERVHLSANGSTWAARDFGPAGGIYWGSTDASGGTRVVLSDPTANAYGDLVMSPNGEYGAAEVQFQAADGNYVNGWEEFVLKTGHVVAAFSSDESTPSAPQMASYQDPVVTNSGRMFAFTASGAGQSQLLSHGLGDPKFLPVEAGGLSFPAGFGNLGISPNGTAIVVPVLSSTTRALVTYSMSIVSDIATVNLASKRSSLIPDKSLGYYGPWLGPVVSDDGTRVAAGAGSGSSTDGGYWYGTADSSGGTTQVFTPGGQAKTNWAQVGVWSPDITSALYVDNNNYWRVGSPFGEASTPAAPPVTPTPTSTCAPVAIVALRGSKEHNDHYNGGQGDAAGDAAAGLLGVTQTDADGVTSNGWEGPVLHRLLAGTVKARTRDGFKLGSTPIIGIGYGAKSKQGYPALLPVVHTQPVLAKSASEGAAYALTVMHAFQTKQPKGCTTHFIVVGYSQGAMAARILTFSPHKGLSFSAFLFAGDPFQKPHAPGVSGSGGGGDGVERVTTDVEIPRRKLDTFYLRSWDTITLCHKGDPFCDFNIALGVGAILKYHKPHETYFDGSAKEAQTYGSILLAWVEQARMK